MTKLHWPTSWNIPSSPSSCLALNSSQTVTCNFGLYGNATDLSADQKLAPNDEVTGRTIVKAFVASAIITLVLSAILVLDKIKVHILDKRRDKNGQAEGKFYLKLVHTIETLLHTLSDQQLITSIALLLSINHQACTISAYHYNLVCTMLLMGIITHLNTLINIPDFLYKGKTVAFYRFFGICVQLVLSGFVFSARHTKTFPSKASSLAILPAACFENMNATQDFGFSDFFSFAQNVTAGVTTNSTVTNATVPAQLMHNIDAATSATTGMGEYATLVVFMFIAILVLVYDFFEAQSWLGNSSKQVGMRLSTIFFSFASIAASVIIIAIALTRYNTLRDQMEVPKWYNNDTQDEWTYSQILPILLLGSGSIAVLKAVTDSLGGIRGRRYETPVKDVAQDVGKDAQDGNDYQG